MLFAHLLLTSQKRFKSELTQDKQPTLSPLRDGSEKNECSPGRAPETIVARYKRSQLGVVAWSTKRKANGFFGHVTQQVNGLREGEAAGISTASP
jgi:hypothetical protein